MGKFFPYKPLTLEELNKIIPLINLPTEIKEQPHVKELKKSFMVTYRFWPLNPHGQKIYPLSLVIYIPKKWKGRIRLECQVPEIKDMMYRYFRIRLLALWTRWDKTPIKHGSWKPDEEKRCSICYKQGNFKGQVCSECMAVKMDFHRKIQNKEKMEADIKSLKERLDAWTLIKLFPDYTATELTRLSVMDKRYD